MNLTEAELATIPDEPPELRQLCLSLPESEIELTDEEQAATCDRTSGPAQERTVYTVPLICDAKLHCQRVLLMRQHRAKGLARDRRKS